MGFVLENVTDEDRRDRGFAVTRSELKVSRGMKFVSLWAIDKNEDAVIFNIASGRNNWQMELHWKSNVILIKTLINETRWKESKDSTGLKKYDTFFEIIELTILRSLQKEIKKIEKLVVDGMSAYGHGSLKYNGSGRAVISPTVSIKLPLEVKSKVKLVDFELKH